MNNQILLVEDDLTLAGLISAFFKNKNYNCDTAHNIDTALKKFEANNYDLIILDLKLKDEDGNVLLKTIREYDGNFEKKRKAFVPVLILSGNNKLEIKKFSYSQGADLYSEKPLKTEELFLIANSLIRRGMGYTGDVLRIGKLLLLDLNKKILKLKFFEEENNIIDLTRSEFELFKLLALNKGFTVDKKVIKKQLYFGRNFDINEGEEPGKLKEDIFKFSQNDDDGDFKTKKAPLGLKVIDVMICKIRKKIDDKINQFKNKLTAIGENPNVSYIHTDWAEGYACYEKNNITNNKEINNYEPS